MTKLLIALLLMAVCVFVHAAGLAVALGWVRQRAGPDVARSASRVIVSLIGIAAWAILLHIAQILIWAVAYVTVDAMPDMAAATYFSAVTYTTTGYGDLVLPAGWRVLGGVEALTGILMCGLSTGLFFALFAKVIEGGDSTRQAARGGSR